MDHHDQQHKQKSYTQRKLDRKKIVSHLLIRYMLYGLAFGMLVWMFEALIDFLWFYKGTGTLIELMLTKIPPHEIYIRSFIIISFIVFGALASVFAARRLIAEQQTKQLQKELAATLNSIGDAVISTDIKGNVARMNPVAEQLTAWKLKNAKGKPLPEVFHIVNAHSGKKVDNPVQKVLAEGKTVGLANHTMLIAADGTKYQIADSAAPVLKDDNNIIGVVMVFRDVTENYKMQEALKKKEWQLTEAQSISKTGSWEFHLNTGKVKASEEARRIYGLDPEKEITIKKVQTIPLPEYRKIMDKAMQKLIKGEAGYDIKFKIKQQNTGKIRYIHSIGSYNPETNVVLGTIQDITEQQRAEDEIKLKNEEYLASNEELNESLQYIKQINTELEEAKDKAEESDRLKSAFLANMSHEIRTPMNSILGFAHMLRKPVLSDKKQQKYLQIIEQSGRRMLNTINDIMDISRIESGQTKVHETEFDIREQVQYFHTLFSPEAGQKGLKLFFSTNEHQQTFIKTDKEKLDAILTNLIKNAIKYTDSGHVTFDYKLENNQVKLYVEDTGIGIPENRGRAIFDRFVQADIDDKEVREGTGLGLAITKAYVEMLGGKIWFESAKNKGTTFFVELPVTILT